MIAALPDDGGDGKREAARRERPGSIVADDQVAAADLGLDDQFWRLREKPLPLNGGLNGVFTGQDVDVARPGQTSPGSQLDQALSEKT